MDFFIFWFFEISDCLHWLGGSFWYNLKNENGRKKASILKCLKKYYYCARIFVPTTFMFGSPLLRPRERHTQNNWKVNFAKALGHQIILQLLLLYPSTRKFSIFAQILFFWKARGGTLKYFDFFGKARRGTLKYFGFFGKTFRGTLKYWKENNEKMFKGSKEKMKRIY